jgi:prepilin-type N-terminal cleavage/methylation domain-containing protein
MRKLGKEYSGRGFTLLELSIVLTLIGVVLAVGFTVMTAGLQASEFNATVARMDAIEKAILNYAVANNRIPCPTDLTLTTGSANYGYEAGATAGGTGTGECVTGMTPAANFKASSGAEEGGLPTRALRLPDEYIYDGWGRKFRYAVDPTYTKSSALPIAAACGSGFTPDASAITVNDSTGATRTTAAMYALISHGANGHGAYTSNGVVLNAGSVNANDLTNCHCTSAGAYSGTYTPTYVEKVPTQDPANALDNFDDIVTFKEPWQMQAQNYPLTGANCSQYIYVTDLNNNRVEIFNTSGSYIGQIGCATGACSTGSGNGQFNGPFGIAIDSSGNIWVADYYNSRVQKFNSSGSYLSQLDVGYGQQWVNFDKSGNLWMSGNFGSGEQITEYKTSGTLNVFPTSSLGYYPGGVVIDASGNVWINDRNGITIYEYTNAGTLISSFSNSALLSQPEGMAFDANGNIWVVSSWTNSSEGQGCDNVPKFSSSGTFLAQAGCGGVEGTCDPSSANGYFNGPQNVAVDSSGNIWVTDYYNNRVQKFNSSGSWLASLGGTSSACTNCLCTGPSTCPSSSGSGNGQFNGPWGIAIGSR